MLSRTVGCSGNIKMGRTRAIAQAFGTVLAVLELSPWYNGGARPSASDSFLSPETPETGRAWMNASTSMDGKPPVG